MGRVGRAIPDWIRFSIPGGEEYKKVRQAISAGRLHTICVEARCPNIGECFCRGTATFLIMGNICTRNCRYCAVEKGVPSPPDLEEPLRIARAVRSMGLRHAVITSVTRDDLNDGGASIFAATVRAVRDLSPECGIELLLPDFKSSLEESVREVCLSRPDVINHNIEVAGPLYGQLRPRGDYGASLALLEAAGGYGIPVKSGLMIGFGESMDDIRHTLEDLRSTGCTILTVGQYLQSRREGFPVAKYYSPQEFLEIEAMALGLGFASVQSGPLVRSSYRAAAMAEERAI